MYTSYIGRRFLNQWNRRTGQQLTAQQFFDEQMFPLFYQSEKYLQWIASSPFTQDVNKEEKIRVKAGESPYQIKLDKFHNKIASGIPPDGSFVIGFPAAGTDGTTSGQVSGVMPQVTVEEVYCSWIGSALGIGVGSSYSILIDKEEVLWTLFEGWTHYRAHLDQRNTLRGNQIDTWNGLWLTHAFDEDYNPHQSTLNFFFDEKIEVKDGIGGIATQSWVSILLALAGKYKSKLMAYAYCLSKQNKTIGFIPLELSEIENLYQLSQRLFELSPAIRDWKKLRALYETHYKFPYACQLGSIGLAAIEPAKLRDYLPNGGKTRVPSLKTDSDRYQFELYQLWILAMLNNQDLYAAADQLAAALHCFNDREDQRGGGRGKVNVSRKLEQVFVKHRPAFIEKLTELLDEANAAPEFREPFEQAVQQVMLMPVDNFPLFIILTRFRYVAQSAPAVAIPSESSPA